MFSRTHVAVLLAIVPSALAQSLSGLWDATVKVNGNEIPFRIELAGEGSAIKGSFFNGDEKFPSTTGRFENGSLVLNWEYYASKLEAAFDARRAVKSRKRRSRPSTTRCGWAAGPASRIHGNQTDHLSPPSAPPTHPP
jgi:hypothetical protein